jgi:hypothetical protein
VYVLVCDDSSLSESDYTCFCMCITFVLVSLCVHNFLRCSILTDAYPYFSSIMCVCLCVCVCVCVCV